MKAITLTQPWATLVAIGAKRIETRSWYTEHRGRIAIHAAMGFPPTCKEIAQSRMVLDLVRPYFRDDRPYLEQFPRGYILATTSIEDCLATEVIERHVTPFSEQERALGNYDPGRYGFLLGNVVRLAEPVPMKGMLLLWNWDGPTEDEQDWFTDSEHTRGNDWEIDFTKGRGAKK